MKAAKIDDESKSLSILSSDLDYYRRRYFIREQGVNETIMVNFVSPYIICFEEYRFFLLKNSITQHLPAKYHYRPDYLSYDTYGTTNLWSLLLYINNIPCIEEFDKDDVVIPSKFSVQSIATDTVKRNPSQEIVQLIEILRKDTDKLYYSFQSIPVIRNISNPTILTTDSKLLFNREFFTVDIITSRQRYIPLKYQPISESIQFRVQDNPSYIYGKHYKLDRINGKYVITWDPKRLTSGIGLVGTITEGSQLEVIYARK